MKSILHRREDHTCYLCMLLDSNYDLYSHLEEHHIFNGPNRKLSTKYGLTVYLCAEHHRIGPAAGHINPDVRAEVQKNGQRAFMKKYPDKDFMKIFGKNYL